MVSDVPISGAEPRDVITHPLTHQRLAQQPGCAEDSDSHGADSLGLARADLSDNSTNTAWQSTFDTCLCSLLSPTPHFANTIEWSCESHSRNFRAVSKQTHARSCARRWRSGDRDLGGPSRA